MTSGAQTPAGTAGNPPPDAQQESPPTGTKQTKMERQWNYDLFIDGEWTGGESVGTLEVINPATEAVIGSVAEASTKDAVRASEAARRAFDEGPRPRMKPRERGASLVRMAEILESREWGVLGLEEFCEIKSLNWV